MTREKAQTYIRDLLTGHNEDCTTNHYWDVANGVDKIYDDFESRTCENCNMYIKEEMKCSFLAITVIDDDFSCSKFVSKDTKGEEDDI